MASLVIGLSLLLDFFVAQFFLPNSNQNFRLPHHYYHHALRPNFDGADRWGPYTYPFYTDNLGFRSDTIRNVSLSTTKDRLLLMGDSHTEGVGLPYKKTFAGKLTKLSQDVEVLNAGVVSYSPKLYYLKTKYLIEKTALKFDHIYVLLDISDIQNAYAYADFKPRHNSLWKRIYSKFLKYLQRNSALYYHTSQYFKNRSRKIFYEKIADQALKNNPSIELYQGFFNHFDDDVLLSNPAFHTTISEWFSDESLYNRWGQDGVKMMTREMEKLIHLCDSNDIHVVITVHPWRNNVQRGNINDRHVQYWRNFAKKHQVGFINLYSAFITGEDPDSVIKACYFPNDNHWSMEGHQKVFDKIRPFFPNQSTDPSHSFLITALDAYEKQNFSHAKINLHHYIQSDSTNIYALYYAALVDMEMGDFEEAQHKLHKLRSMDFSYPNVKRQIDQLSLRKEIYALSLSIAEDSSGAAFLERGRLYFELRNYDLAYRDFARANQINPQAKEPYYYLGLIEYRLRKRVKRASTLFNRALQIDPEYREVYIERADLYEFLGNKKLAEQDIHKANALN